MRCQFDKILLEEYAIGEVKAAERTQVESHLSACADCRLEVTDLRRLVRELTALPEPEFPPELEETLVRSAIQAGRAALPVRSGVRAAGARPGWVYVLSGAAGLGFVMALLLLFWPARFAQIGSSGEGGVGQGLGLLDSVFRWVDSAGTTWDSVRDFLNRFAPVGKAVRIAVAGVGSSLWTAVALGAVATALFLWRLTSTGQKKARRMNHVEPHC